MRDNGNDSALYVGRAPSGFLDLLGTKVNGRSPQYLADQVVATVDYFPWMTIQRRVYRQFTVNPMNNTGSWHDTANVVPDGHLFFVNSVSLISQGVLGAGTTVRAAIGYKVGDGGSIQVLKIADDHTSTAGQYMTAQYQGPGFFLRPGQAVGWFVSQLVLGVAPVALCDYEYVDFIL